MSYWKVGGLSYLEYVTRATTCLRMVRFREKHNDRYIHTQHTDTDSHRLNLSFSSSLLSFVLSFQWLITSYIVYYLNSKEGIQWQTLCNPSPSEQSWAEVFHWSTYCHLLHYQSIASLTLFILLLITATYSLVRYLQSKSLERYETHLLHSSSSFNSPNRYTSLIHITSIFLFFSYILFSMSVAMSDVEVAQSKGVSSKMNAAFTTHVQRYCFFVTISISLVMYFNLKTCSHSIVLPTSSRAFRDLIFVLNTLSLCYLVYAVTGCSDYYQKLRDSMNASNDEHGKSHSSSLPISNNNMTMLVSLILMAASQFIIWGASLILKFKAFKSTSRQIQDPTSLLANSAIIL